MRKITLMIRYYFLLLRNYFLLALSFAFSMTPWGKAYAIHSFRRYLESDWYKGRSEVFPKHRAVNLYFERGESWFFKRRMSRSEKIAILLRPYSFIEEAKKLADELKVADYLY